MTILTLAPPSAAVSAADDWFTWINQTSVSANTAAKGVGALLATVFILITAWKVRGAMAGMIAGAIAAILFIYILNNANAPEIQEKVKDTVKGLHRLEMPRGELPEQVT